MKLADLVYLLLGASWAFGQVRAQADQTFNHEFGALLRRFRASSHSEATIQPPLIFSDDKRKYKIVLSENVLKLTKKEVILRNPFGGEEFPLAYSVIYQNHLIALFEPGHFACYDLKTLARNPALERSFNTRTFQYHWVIADKLIGLSNGQHYCLNANQGWQPYTQPVPFGRRPKLYEDDQYLSFMNCHGEFGGTVFFFDKRDQRTHFMPATCANSVLRTEKGYQVLANLGHLSGFVNLTTIPDPRRLPVARSPSEHRPGSGSAGNPAIPPELDWYGIQVFSGFYHDGKPLYVVHWGEATFLARIVGNTLTIVDPLFNSRLYTHQPITMQYANGIVLMNLDFYGQARYREVSCLIKNGTTLTRIIWNRQNEYEDRFH